MIKFNSKNVSVGLIKEKLKSINLPTIKVLEEDMYVIEGCLYIYKNMIFRALKDGLFYLENGLVPSKASRDDYAYFRYICPYSDNMKLDNITKNLTISNIYYDSYTHEFLGDYLRFLKAHKGIDLMPLYNCFSNVICNLNLSFTHTERVPIWSTGGISYDTIKTEHKFSEKDSAAYKVFAVPVRPFNKYTIAIDCPGTLEMVLCYCKNNTVIYKDFDDFDFYSTYKTVSNAQFTNPFVYDTSNRQFYNKYFNRDDSMLKLLIKVPIDSTSSIVVLEGDYTNYNKIKLNVESEMFKGQSLLNKKVYTNDAVLNDKNTIVNAISRLNDKRDAGVTALSLLKLNSNEQYAMSDRLLEYLFGNVITPDDYYSNNIQRVQNKLNILGKGVWTENIKNASYDRVDLDKVSDVLGYIDKDSEKAIDLVDGE